MTARWPPFYDDNPFGIYEKIVSGKVNYPSSLDSVAKDIIRKVLRPHVRTRFLHTTAPGHRQDQAPRLPEERRERHQGAQVRRIF